MVADQELDVSVDGKWAKQSQDKGGNPLVMVNVLAHDLRLCLAQWPGIGEKARAVNWGAPVGSAMTIGNARPYRK